MYTLYDSKAEFYSAPFFAPNETVATRDFHKLIHVTGAIAPAYAGDFTYKTSITSEFGTVRTIKRRPINISRRNFIKVMG
jgi:hypothetical protein